MSIINLILFFFFITTAFAQDSIKFNSTKENLGSDINTTFNEHWPVISPDGKTIFFLRDGDPQNTSDAGDEVWYSVLDENGRWTKAINIGYPINLHYGSSAICSITPDGNTILLCGIYHSNGTVTYDGLSLSHRTKTGWSFPQKINIKNFYNKNNVLSYFLANDGSTLLLGIERDDSFGDDDIYVCFKTGENEWSVPINLGSTINTKYFEGDAFLASDGVTLYFESKGHGGYGGTDIFFSKRLDSTWKNWTSPQNLGMFINTKGDEQEFYITAKGDYAYFASDSGTFGGMDIFRIQIPQNKRPEPVVLIYGKVINSKTKEPLESEIKYEILPEGKLTGIAISNPLTGEYKITLPAGKLYGIRAEAKNYASVNNKYDADTIKKYCEVEMNLELVPIEVGQIVILKNIFFDFNKYELKPESFPELDRIIKFLYDNPSMEIEISGHTDNIGSDEYNNKLSYERANAVLNYLVSKFISASRLTAKGYGKTKPIATNDTEEGRQLNRRVEFIILKK